ncbi:MAG: DUF1674 domain-containing protein [Alphaproteobacteria bacterium]|nr:DUF1674 domain-containing protein [Alphaproteobacteria bacterium]
MEKPQQKPPAKGENTPKQTPQPAHGEVGGAKGPEPTRYGDWQHKGRVSDF